LQEGWHDYCASKTSQNNVQQQDVCYTKFKVPFTLHILE